MANLYHTKINHYVVFMLPQLSHLHSLPLPNSLWEWRKKSFNMKENVLIG